jgi:hypothetical protein
MEAFWPVRTTDRNKKANRKFSLHIFGLFNENEFLLQMYIHDYVNLALEIEQQIKIPPFFPYPIID